MPLLKKLIGFGHESRLSRKIELAMPFDNSGSVFEAPRTEHLSLVIRYWVPWQRLRKGSRLGISHCAFFRTQVSATPRLSIVLVQRSLPGPAFPLYLKVLHDTLWSQRCSRDCSDVLVVASLKETRGGTLVGPGGLAVASLKETC